MNVKKCIPLFLGFFLFSLAVMTQDSLQETEVKEIAVENSQQLEKRIKGLEEKVKGYESIGTIAGIIITLVATVLSFLSLLGYLNKSLDHLVTKHLAKRLNVSTEVLETALVDFTEDFKALKKAKILILSKESDQLWDLKSKLGAGGFDEKNLIFKGIDEKVEITNEHLIFFNRMGDSKLTTDEIEKVIEANQKRVGAFFYYGSKQVPVKKWNKWKSFNSNIAASNMEDTLVSGLVRAIKNYKLV